MISFMEVIIKKLKIILLLIPSFLLISNINASKNTQLSLKKLCKKYISTILKKEEIILNNPDLDKESYEINNNIILKYGKMYHYLECSRFKQ